MNSQNDYTKIGSRRASQSIENVQQLRRPSLKSIAKNVGVCVGLCGMGDFLAQVFREKEFSEDSLIYVEWNTESFV